MHVSSRDSISISLHEKRYGILSEDSLLQWVGVRRENSQDALRNSLFEQPEVQEFIQWLEDEGSEEDEEDVEEDESEV